MSYLLDTNALSDARKQAYPPLNRWLARQPRSQIAISVVTLLEIERGILQVERQDSRSGAHLRKWLEQDVLAVFAGRTHLIDAAVAKTAASLHVPDPMPEFDALIAATAIVHDLVLVTRNIRDFEASSVRLLDPWQL